MTAIAEKTGEDLNIVMAKQAASNKANQIIKNAAQAKELSDKIQQVVTKNKNEAASTAFHKSIEPYISSEKIVNVERLKSIEGIDQINKFKEYTNNFTNLEKLTPEEILYLNLCDWLEPQAAAINAEIKAAGGLKFMDPVTKAEVVIEKFDLVHSLLGEMKPGSIRETIKGGHLLISELKAATLEIGTIKSLDNGFLIWLLNVVVIKK